jgi:hypothetical protein
MWRKTLAGWILTIAYIVGAVLTVRDNLKASKAKRNAPPPVVKLTEAELKAEWDADVVKWAARDEKWADFNAKFRR